MKLDIKKIWDFKIKDDKSVRKQAVKFLCGFLAVMIVFTLLSRAADSLTVAKVQAARAENKVIEHKLEASGKVKENRVQAVIAESGITIDRIYVNEGQMVEAGGLLLQLNIADLDEQILIAKQEIEKLKLGNKDVKSQETADNQKKSTAAERASQDYESATAKGDRQIAEAADALSRAQSKLAEFRQGGQGGMNPGQTGDEIEKTLEQTCREKETVVRELEAEKKKLEESQSDLGDMNERLQNAVNEADQARKALENYKQQKDGESQNQSQNNEKQLEQEVATAQKAYDDAVAAKDEGQQTANRAWEDANAPEGSKSAAEIAELDIKQKELKLVKLEALRIAEGKLISPVKGMITKLDAVTGGKTSETAAVTLADLSSGCRFVAQIPQSQDAYIARGDKVSLKPSNNGETVENLTVDTVKANEENKEMLDVTVSLGADVMEIGTSAELSAIKKSRPYNTCVPMEALHEEKGKYFVFILKEEETVLGKELTAQRVDVTVKDKNTTYAALEEGAVTSEQQVISKSDKNIEAGSRVRLIES